MKNKSQCNDCFDGDHCKGKRNCECQCILKGSRNRIISQIREELKREMVDEKLNYKRMIEEVDKIIGDESSFLHDMECKEHDLDTKPFTQIEASQMSKMLGDIYLIAHCTHCEACQGKYKTK